MTIEARKKWKRGTMQPTRILIEVFASLIVTVCVASHANSQDSRLIGLIDFSQESTILRQLDRGVRIQIAPVELDGFAIGRSAFAEPLSPFDATALLNAYSSLGQLIDNPSSGTVTVRLLPREAQFLEPEQLDRGIGTLIERGGSERSISYIVSKPDDVRMVTADRIDNPGPLYEEVRQLHDIPGSRILMFDGVLLTLHASQDAPQKRSEVLVASLAAAKQFSRQIKTPADLVANRALVDTYATEMDTLFLRLDSRGLMTDRLAVYQTLWNVAYSPMIRHQELTPTALHGVLAFNGNLAEANNPMKCTTYVTGTKGSGATIQYAKPSDARASMWHEGPRPTMDALELDRGSYSFRLLRNGNETGKRDSVDCDRASQGVEVPEQ